MPSSLAVVQGSTTGDSLSEEAYLEHLSGLVHAITPSRQPLLQVASAEDSSTTSGDSEVEDETSNSVQTTDAISILSASLVELLSGVKQRLQSSSMAYSQLCQVLLANCSAMGIDTDGEERDQVTRIFDRLKKAESTAKDLSERYVSMCVICTTLVCMYVRTSVCAVCTYLCLCTFWCVCVYIFFTPFLLLIINYTDCLDPYVICMYVPIVHILTYVQPYGLLYDVL